MDLIRICSNSVFNLKVKTNNEFQFLFRCSRHFFIFPQYVLAFSNSNMAAYY